MDYNKIYINSSNIIDNLESMYYKTNISYNTTKKQKS